MKAEDTAPQPERVRFERPAPSERREGWVLREARIDGHVIRVAAREEDRRGLDALIRDFRIGFATIAVEDQAQQGHEFDEVVDAVEDARRGRRRGGVVGIEIERTKAAEPGRMTSYAIDPDIGKDWLHIYLDGGSDATVTVDSGGKVRVHRLGDPSHVVTSSWSGSAKGQFRILGVQASHYGKTGLGTVWKRQHV